MRTLARHWGMLSEIWCFTYTGKRSWIIWAVFFAMFFQNLGSFMKEGATGVVTYVIMNLLAWHLFLPCVLFIIAYKGKNSSND